MSELISPEVSNIDVLCSLLTAWRALGDEIEKVATMLGIKRCRACRDYITPGKHHEPLNGNQMFACTEVDGPAFHRWMSEGGVPSRTFCSCGKQDCPEMEPGSRPWKLGNV